MPIKKLDKRINVTKPTLPDLGRYTEMLENIWETQWLTNNGQYVQMLEQRLSEFLGVPCVSTMSNGTLALMIAIRALCDPPGNIITTPFTFPATAHAIQWLGFTPVFADVDPQTGNINPEHVAELMDAETKGVLAVHVYGNPCDNNRLSELCQPRDIPLIYDAAHAFGVTVAGDSILNWGDASAISFHATKLFSSIEGGAVTTRSASIRTRADMLRNFGILDEETVAVPGINAKMSEVHAAYGLLRLESTAKEIADRARIAEIYDAALSDVPGIKSISGNFKGERNFSYYPVRIKETDFGRSRDQLHLDLIEYNIYTRKYFYPLCTRTSVYRELPSAAEALLPNAHQLETEALCLPIYGELAIEDAHAIADIIVQLHGSNTKNKTGAK